MKRVIFASEDLSEDVNVFQEYISSLGRQQSELSPEFLNSYCIYTTYFNQYAEGVTGCNRYSHAYLSDDGEGWKFKKDANAAARSAGMKSYKKRGRDTGYGEVGAEEFKVEIIRVSDMLNLETYVRGYIPHRFEPISKYRGGRRPR